jgi:hypothetical protein
MSANDSFIGQIDLLMLPKSGVQTINGQECIVIPCAANPAIYMSQAKTGQPKALLDIFIRATQNSQYGNSHFVKANVGKTNREKYGISREQLPQYSPILGNLRPYTAGQATQEARPALDDDDDLPEGEFKGF